jgi:hypothetical protein
LLPTHLADFSSSVCDHTSKLNGHLKSTNPTSPNHALQRTAPGVTACAPARRPAPAAFPHRLRRPPRSLSLGSLGKITATCEI